jgi:glycosyltransferase involved in cell wall biosynthesis
MELSIIIPSFERAELLEYGLKSLMLQSIQCKYEIIVVNDGIEDNTQKMCEKYSSLPIKYIFSGHRNEKEKKWRTPGFSINIGAKLAKGKNLILTCPEIYILDLCVNEMVDALNVDPKRLVITNGKDDRQHTILDVLKNSFQIGVLNHMYNTYTPKEGVFELNTEFPFFMGINKEEFISIGGYDEDFVGYCWDDADIVDRLVSNKCYYYKLKNKRVIHLYHPRLRYGLEDTKILWKYNQKLYNDRKNIIIRNQNKAWGKNE